LSAWKPCKLEFAIPSKKISLFDFHRPVHDLFALKHQSQILNHQWQNCSITKSSNHTMFARKIKVQYSTSQGPQLCPMKWLDNFSMRNFTNDSIFDDTLPVTDGELEVGTRVPLDRLKASMEDWFRRKGYIGKQDELILNE
jgi:hypothetical protein